MDEGKGGARDMAEPETVCSPRENVIDYEEIRTIRLVQRAYGCVCPERNPFCSSRWVKQAAGGSAQVVRGHLHRV